MSAGQGVRDRRRDRPVPDTGTDTVPDIATDTGTGTVPDIGTDIGAVAEGVEDGGGSRRLRLTPASAIRMRPVRWTWQERIPAGAITIIPGREGIGKSLTLAWLAAQVTRGVLPGVHAGTPRPVIYAATEDSWSHTIGPRLAAAGADLDMVYRVEVERLAGTGMVTDSLTLPLDTAALAAEVTRLGVALLAADPLLSLISERIDTHRDRDLRTALEPLARLADTTGCAVVGLAHFNKSASGDALNLITGSRAFSAVARAVLAIARDTGAEDGSCVMSQAKNNLGRLDLPSLRYRIDTAEIPTEEGAASVGRLVFTGESDRSVSDILADAEGDPDERHDRDDAASWLADYLTEQGGEATREDVLKAARAAGIAERTLKRAKGRAKVTSERSGFPARALWRLPNPGDEQSPPLGLPAPVGPQSGQLGQDSQRGPTGPTVARQDDPTAPRPDSADSLSPDVEPWPPTAVPGAPGTHPAGQAVCLACRLPMRFDDGTHTHPTCTVTAA